MYSSRCSIAIKALLFVALFGFTSINITTKVMANSDIITDSEEKRTRTDVITDPRVLELIFMIGHTTIAYDGDELAFIALDPRDSKVVYAATKAGALYKSVNGGKKWRHVNNKFDMTRHGNLAIDPNDTTIMYANAFMIDDDENIGGIMKSTNSGLDWNLLMELKDFRNHKVSIVIDPNNSSTVYVGSRSGRIYKSTDAGLNWKTILDNIDDIGSSYAPILDISHTKPSILYAGVWDRNSNRILKSIDNGQTWININNGMDNGVSFVAIAVSQHDSNTVYALFSNCLYKSTNAGESWRELKKSPYEKYGTLHRGILLTTDPSIIYLNTTRGLYRSANGGESWGKTQRYEKDNNIDADFIAVHPKNHRIIYAGNYKRLYKSTNSGRTWKTILRHPVKF